MSVADVPFFMESNTDPSACLRLQKLYKADVIF